MESRQLLLASGLVGVLSTIWGAMLVFPDYGHFVAKKLLAGGEVSAVGALMAIAGIMILVGCLMPLRWARQKGLGLAIISWSSLVGFSVQEWRFGPLLWMGVAFVVAFLYLLVADVMCKPRARCHGDS